MSKYGKGFVLSFFALVACGCSTWRCRGFVDTMDRPADLPQGRYVLDSIEFMNMAADNLESRERSPMFAWLSEQDTLIGTSYLEDIAKSTGATNAAPGSVRIAISLVPMEERKSGRWSIGWPLCCTLGVFPCHFTEEIPLDVIVRFDRDVEGRPDLPAYSCATACVGQIRIDRQYGLTRMDMDAPPPAQSAVGEIRDDGTVGTGRELRMERFRSVFIQTVSAVVLNAMAWRESGRFTRVDQAATEFGAVPFPPPAVAERAQTTGWGKDPRPPAALPPESLEAFLSRVWSDARTTEEVRLKRMVENGMIQKAEWKRQMTDVWRRRNSEKEEK